MVLNHGDYRDILKTEFAERVLRNSRYSLRSFARDLGISPARLSLVLSGQAGFSSEKALQIAERLGMNRDEAEYFRDLVDSVHSRSGTNRKLAAARLQKRRKAPEYQQLQMDLFRVISDWYHFAIVELSLTKGFKSEPAWIARRLGIPEIEARHAIERLVQVGVIDLVDGKIVPRSDFRASPDGIPSESVKKAHRQILEKAQQALAVEPVHERDFSAIELAFNSSDDMERAKERIRDFRRAFDREFSGANKKDDKDSVYCLAIQFFELTEQRSPMK